MISAVHVFEKLNSLNEFYNLFWQFKVVETKHFKKNYLSFLYVTERWNY